MKEITISDIDLRKFKKLKLKTREADFYFSKEMVLFKEYKPILGLPPKTVDMINEVREKKIKHLIEFNDLDDIMATPKVLVYNDNHKIEGYMMQYYPNSITLQEYIEKNKKREALIYELLIKISYCLERIHKHNICVHDLSERNILVLNDGNIMFVDVDSYQIGEFVATTVPSKMRQHYYTKNGDIKETPSFAKEALLMTLLENCYNLEIYNLTKEQYLEKLMNVREKYNITDEVNSVLEKLKDRDNQIDYIHNYMPKKIVKK